MTVLNTSEDFRRAAETQYLARRRFKPDYTPSEMTVGSVHNPGGREVRNLKSPGTPTCRAQYRPVKGGPRFNPVLEIYEKSPKRWFGSKRPRAAYVPRNMAYGDWWDISDRDRQPLYRIRGDYCFVMRELARAAGAWKCSVNDFIIRRDDT